MYSSLERRIELRQVNKQKRISNYSNIRASEVLNARCADDMGLGTAFCEKRSY